MIKACGLLWFFECVIGACVVENRAAKIKFKSRLGVTCAFGAVFDGFKENAIKSITRYKFRLIGLGMEFKDIVFEIIIQFYSNSKFIN